METLTPRGMRDFAPAEKIAREKVVSMLKEQFERFGFSPLETPIVERYDVLSAKYAGGAEILKETFRMTDQGGRELALRYDLTVPLSRFIASNPDVKLPFKRYQIGTVYRDGPIKLGRTREFYQCDADIVGAKGALADAQCLQLGLAVFSNLGMPFSVYVNSMALLKACLRKEGVEEDQLEQAMLILDKLKKIGQEAVEAELDAAGISASALSNLIELSEKRSIDAFKERYDGVELSRLEEVFELLSDDRVIFDPSLSRGLSYYTGIVFEVYLNESEVKGSVSAGGRYDTMIASFIGKGEYPAVGISFGLEPIAEALRLQESEVQTVTKVFVVPIKTTKESNALTSRLREAGINTDIDLMDRGISKNLEYASVLKIPYVLIVGKKELEQGTYTLKDMNSGEERQLGESELLSVLQ